MGQIFTKLIIFNIYFESLIHNRCLKFDFLDFYTIIKFKRTVQIFRLFVSYTYFVILNFKLSNYLMKYKLNDYN